MKYTKKNRPKYFDKLLPDVQQIRIDMERKQQVDEIKELDKLVSRFSHHEPTFREIQEDKLRI